MASMRGIAHLCAWSIVLALAGCAATPTVRQPGTAIDGLERYQHVRVVVDASEAIRARDGYAPTSAALGQEFVEALRASGRFGSVGVGEAPGPGTLRARLTITDLNHVHGAARGFFGVLAGRAILKVTMSLKDESSGEVLGTVFAGHESSHAQGVFSPTTSGQVSAIARELAARLANGSG